MSPAKQPFTVDPSGRRWLVNPQGETVEVPANMAAALAERAARGCPVDARAVPYALQSSYVSTIGGRILSVSTWLKLLEVVEESFFTIERVFARARRRARREAARRAA